MELIVYHVESIFKMKPTTVIKLLAALATVLGILTIFLSSCEKEKVAESNFKAEDSSPIEFLEGTYSGTIYENYESTVCYGGWDCLPCNTSYSTSDYPGSVEVVVMSDNAVRLDIFGKYSDTLVVLTDSLKASGDHPENYFSGYCGFDGDYTIDFSSFPALSIQLNELIGDGACCGYQKYGYQYSLTKD
jgi:hypothetical protein